MANALTEPTAAAENPAAESSEPQPEVVAESGKTILSLGWSREVGKHITDAFFSPLHCDNVNFKHTFPISV